VLATIAFSAEALSQDAPSQTREQQDALWLANACEPTPVDTALWPRYEIGDVTVAMPIQYGVSRQVPFTLTFRWGSYGEVRIRMHRDSKYALDRQVASVRMKETWCEGSYGGYANRVHAWVERGRYHLATTWEPTWNGKEEWVFAQISTDRPEEARRLRAALNTMQPVRDDPSRNSKENENGWFWNPCLPDSADTWGWTRYDLHGVRFRVPPNVRHVKVPNTDELHFSTGHASLRLRLHNNASQLFAEVNTPQKRYRQCYNDVSGQLAELMSFRPGQTSYGFAALWPDADRGEWLAAVISGSRLEDVTLLRRVLYAIDFPGKKR
jgi:hypothetical protein